LGQIWLTAQQELATTTDARPEIAEKRRVLDLVAATVSPNAQQLPEERNEHIHLYNLLGDPSLRLRYPQTIELQVPRGIAPGQKLSVSGIAPLGGELKLFLCYPPGGMGANQRLSQLERYRQANCVELAAVHLPVNGPGEFHTSITVPADAYGPMRVIARIECADGWCTGAATVLVRPGS
jgi:hypothetical protein